jgi:predicted nucleotidyltransferase
MVAAALLPVFMLRTASTTLAPARGQLPSGDEAESAQGSGDHNRSASHVGQVGGDPFHHCYLPRSGTTRQAAQMSFQPGGVATLTSPRVGSGNRGLLIHGSPIPPRTENHPIAWSIRRYRTVRRNVRNRPGRWPERTERTVNVLLSGIVGSTAYGLATPESDIDRLGIYAAPTIAFHGLHPPIGKAATKVTTKPDVTMHEVGKYASLCLSMNPTVTELMWLEPDFYETRTPLGDDLIGIRTAFLSARRTRDAFLGYAQSQFKRLEDRGDGSFSADTRKRTAKHARHLARLVHQGRELYATGHLTVRLDDPQWFRDFGEWVAAGDLDLARKLLARAVEDFDSIRTPLPDRPDEKAAERWLHAVRAAYYQASPV